jgi:Tfp pilus assembly protein PilX
MRGGPGAGPGGGASKVFAPATDANGGYVVVGQKKYGLNEGVIASKNATYLGDVTNKPAPAVNNGMIVTLKGGTVWTVAGTSYLTSLTIDDGSIAAPEGSKVMMTVNGVKTEIKPGKAYSGNIVLSVSK